MMRAALRRPVSFITDHRFTRAHASDYLDDALDASGRERVDAHTHVCPACMRFLSTLRRTITALHTLATPEPTTSSISEAVLTRLRAAANDSHAEP